MFPFCDIKQTCRLIMILIELSKQPCLKHILGNTVSRNIWVLNKNMYTVKSYTIYIEAMVVSHPCHWTIQGSKNPTSTTSEFSPTFQLFEATRRLAFWKFTKLRCFFGEFRGFKTNAGLLLTWTPMTTLVLLGVWALFWKGICFSWEKIP